MVEFIDATKFFWFGFGATLMVIAALQKVIK